MTDDEPELARGQALIAALEAGTAGAPESLLQAMDGRLLVAVVATPEGAPGLVATAFPEAAAFCEMGPQRYLLAAAYMAEDDSAPRAMLAALSARLPAGARAGIAAGPGAIGGRSLIGLVPDRAAAVVGRHAVEGVFLHASARGLAGGPLEAVRKVMG